MTPISRISLLVCALLCAQTATLAQQQQKPPETRPAPPMAPEPEVAPPTPKRPDANTVDRDAVTFSVWGWYPVQLDAQLRKGEEAFSARAGDIDLNADKKRIIPGATLSIPTGKGHHLTFSYFQTRAAGNTTAGVDLNLFGGDYDAGTYLATNYKVQNGKVQFDYTTWPFPINDRKFRIKTLWGVQYTNVQATVDAPLQPVAEGETNATQGSRWFIWPSLGAGIEYRPSPNFRFEFGGSGFYIPDRPMLWDVNAKAVYRVGKVELFGGYKAFHYQTSKKPEDYFKGTISGIFAGAGWRFE